MKLSILHWVASSAWLFGVLSGSYLVTWLALQIWRKEYESWKIARRARRSIAPGLLSRLLTKVPISLALVCGFLLGWGSRDLQQWRNTDQLANVRVISRSSIDPAMYTMETDRHKEFSMRFCPDHVPNLEPGVKLKLLVFEDRGKCQSIAHHKLGFIADRDEQAQPIISQGGIQ